LVSDVFYKIKKSHYKLLKTTCCLNITKYF